MSSSICYWFSHVVTLDLLSYTNICIATSTPFPTIVYITCVVPRHFSRVLERDHGYSFCRKTVLADTWVIKCGR